MENELKNLQFELLSKDDLIRQSVKKEDVVKIQEENQKIVSTVSTKSLFFFDSKLTKLIHKLIKKNKNRNLQEEIHQQKKTIQNLETAINDQTKFHQREISTIKEAHEAKLVSIDSERTFLVQTNNSRIG